MKKIHQSNEKPPIPKKPDMKLISQGKTITKTVNISSNVTPPPPPPLPTHENNSTFVDSNIKLKTRDNSGSVKALTSSSHAKPENKGLINELIKKVKINNEVDKEAEERARRFARFETEKELGSNIDVKKTQEQKVEVAKSNDGIPIPPPLPPMTSITTDSVKKKRTQSMRLPESKSKPLMRELEEKLKRRSKES